MNKEDLLNLQKYGPDSYESFEVTDRSNPLDEILKPIKYFSINFSWSSYSYGVRTATAIVPGLSDEGAIRNLKKDFGDSLTYIYDVKETTQFEYEQQEQLKKDQIRWQKILTKS